MKKNTKMRNLIKLNPFSLDKIKKIKKNPIMIKNQKISNIKPKLNISSNKKKIKDIYEKSFLSRTLTNFRKIATPKNQLSLTNNHKYDDIINEVEKEIKYFNTSELIQSVAKMFEIFQKELTYQLEGVYNDIEIKKILKTNFDSIIKYIINYFSSYENKYSKSLISLKNIIKDLLKKLNDKSINNSRSNISENSSQIINNYTHNNNNIIILDENKKKYFLNEEENIVNLINNLSSNIRICNKKYKSSLINIANLIDCSNDKLVEIKNKLETVNSNIINNYDLNFQYLNQSIKDIDYLYSINVNLITEAKLLDENQKAFFGEAKEIFNNLKINHKLKIKEYQKLFDFIQNIQSKNDSKSNDEHINCYYSINNLSFKKDNKNKNYYCYYNNSNKVKKGKSLPNEIKNNINELKYIKINNKNRTRNLNNYLNETNISYNSRKNNSYNLTNMTNSFNNSYVNSFNTSNGLQNNIFSLKDEDNNKYSNNLFNNDNINNIYYLAENVMDFFNKMNTLQKDIISKKPNINQQKKDFEKFKKQLIEYIRKILDNRYSNQKINQNEGNKLNNFLVNKIINDNFENNNIVLNNNFKFDTNKLNIVFNERYSITENTNSRQNNNNINNNNISNLEEKNKELISEVEKLKEKNKNIMNDINENNNLKKILDNILNLINNILKDSENSNINENEENKEINSLKEINYLDIEQISKKINKFQLYYNDMKEKLKNLKEDKDRLIKESNDNLIKVEKLKEMLDKSNNKINDIKLENTEDEKNNKKSKINFICDTEGNLSFKGESGKFNNNFQSIDEDTNKYIIPSLDNNTTGSFTNINSNLIKLNNNSKNSSDKNITNNNDLNEENKKNLIIKKNDINNDDNFREGYLDINKEILKYQNNLKNKIKSLEEEVQIQKNKNINFFIEIKNEFYDFNEDKIPLSKYTNLLKLYEKEQETNKTLEKKYISQIENIQNNLLKYFKKINYELEIENNNIITTSSLENDNKDKKIDNSENNNIINKFDSNKNNNLHFDYSNMFKTKSILKMEDNNFDIKNNNKELKKIKHLTKENNSLKENEKLLIEQLNKIKEEIREMEKLLEEKEEKIKFLNENFERQTLLQKEKLYIPLRNGLELLITEINLTHKIKEILRTLLNISLYNNEEIEKIFK